MPFRTNTVKTGTPLQLEFGRERSGNMDEINIGDNVAGEGAYGEGLQADLFRGQY